MSQSTIDVSKICSELGGFREAQGWNKLKEILKRHFSLKKEGLKKRAQFLNAVMYSKAPFEYDESLGTTPFHVLQGDIISSRLVQTSDPLVAENSNYIVIPRSCAIQNYGLKQILLARLHPVIPTEERGMQLIGECLRMTSLKAMYFPPTRDQVETDIIGNVAIFSEVSSITNNDLQIATRIESLSEFGAHFFNFFVNTIYTKQSSDDINIRHGSQASTVTL